MKKTIIASAIAAAVAAPAAFADVSVYGKAHVALNNQKKSGVDTDVVESNASRIGFKASEDLGNGMKAFAQVELQLNALDDGNTSATNTTAATSALANARDSFVGISGDFGKVMVGRMAAPIKGALYSVGNIQLADTNAGYDQGKLFSSKSYRVQNATAYSNNFSGVDFTAACVADEVTTGGTAFCENKSFGLSTTVGGIKLAAATMSQTGADDIDIIGASYSANGMKLGVVYEDNDVNASTADKETTGVSFSYAMGNNVISAQWAETDIQGSAADIEQVRLGLEHKMSKSTSVYVSMADYDVNGTNTGDVESVAAGIIMSF